MSEPILVKAKIEKHSRRVGGARWVNKRGIELMAHKLQQWGSGRSNSGPTQRRK